MIVIKDYDPEWIQQFETIRSSLLDILGPRALRIDHIGSTAVPGLGAKDVIDVQVTVEEITRKITQKLVKAGYDHIGRITHDHVPAGENDDPNL